jgi:hypothetical protein
MLPNRRQLSNDVISTGWYAYTVRKFIQQKSPDTVMSIGDEYRWWVSVMSIGDEYHAKW